MSSIAQVESGPGEGATIVNKPGRAAWLASAAVAAVGLAACGGGTGADSADTGDNGGKRTIKVVVAEYSKDHTRAFWEGLNAKYEKATGNKVDLQVVDWNVIDQQVSTMIQNNQPPDILNLNSFASYARDDLLHKTADIISTEVQRDILEPFVEGGKLDGTQYATPDLSSARAFFYNKDLFQRAGVADPPTTWDELVAAAQKIQALGDGTIGYALPLGPEEAQAEFSIWMWNNGGDWKDADGKWTINSDENVQTLQFLSDLANKHQVTQVNPGKTNRTDGAFKLFQDGKVGMVFGFSPLAAELDKQAKVDYGVAQMPTNADKPVTLAVQDFLMAFRKDGNKDAVSAYLNLYYETENIQKFITDEGFLPVTKSGLEQMSGDEKLKAYLDALPNAKQAPTNDPAWDKVKVAVQQNIGAAVQPGGDPRRVLDDLQKLAEQAG
jgi:multiple sugar transport system substrate-binding protein